MIASVKPLPLAARISTGITPLDTMLPALRHLAPQGFVFISNLGLRGPEFVHSEFPSEWQREYERQNYRWADPVLLWSVMGQGDRRWSEINTPDIRGVMEAAKHFGLNYGVILCRGTMKKSILSLAREDRELTNEEVALLTGLMDRLVQDVSLDRSLSAQELETLRQLRDGLAHKEIGAALGISVSTVKLRLNNARQKLGAQSNVHAVALALQRNLI